MALKEQITWEQVESLLEQARQVMDQNMFDWGESFCESGKVFNMVITEKRIQAVVDDKRKLYMVYVNRDDLEASKCSCNNGPLCVHVAATLVKLWKLHSSAPIFAAISRPDQPERNQKAKHGKLYVPNPGQGSSIEEWYRYYREQFKKFSNQEDQLYIPYYSGNFYCHSYLKHLKIFSQSWTGPAQVFFIFHGLLYGMEELEANFTQQSYYLTEHMRNLKDELNKYYSGEIANLARQVNKYGALDCFQTYFPSLSQALRAAIINKDKCFLLWLDFYRDAWNVWSCLPRQVETEKRQLALILDDKELSPQARKRISLCRAHFAFLRGNDAEAWEMIESAGKGEITEVSFNLDMLVERKESERLVYWLRRLASGTGSYQNQELKLLLDYWHHAGRDERFREEMLQVYHSLLPGSMNYYKRALVETGQFKKWAELHICYQLQEAVDEEEAKMVEKADPALLLPIYHQLAVSKVERKNREGYQCAVATLRKLKGIYKKLKRQEEWEEFLPLLNQRYSRLRLFREEMRKGRIQ